MFNPIVAGNDVKPFSITSLKFVINVVILSVVPISPLFAVIVWVVTTGVCSVDQPVLVRI